MGISEQKIETLMEPKGN